jgi:DNA-binding MarR family transcriptional regulator
VTTSPYDPSAAKAQENHKTFTLRERDIRAAAHLLRVFVDEKQDLGREITSLAQENMDAIGDRSDLIECARQTYVNRARRGRVFSNVMFGEAAWNMLLALYVTDQSGQRHTVSGLANLSGSPTTTALRWLDFLETKEGLVTRKPNPTDRRIYDVELTDKARQALDAYFSEVIDDWRSHGHQTSGRQRR